MIFEFKKGGKYEKFNKRWAGPCCQRCLTGTICSSRQDYKGDPKPAMIIFSQKNDGGWSQALDEARQKVEAELGLPIPVVENVPENAAAIKPAVELFIDRGHNIILGSAFGYSDAFKELAESILTWSF